MDRSDARDSHSHFRRRYSTRERELSPKRLRRDRERDRDERRIQDVSDRDSRRRNNIREVDRMRDVKTTEAKKSSDGLKDSSEAKNNGGSDARTLHPDPKEFARSKICFEHNDRGNSGQGVQIRIRHDTDNMRSSLKEHKSGEKSNDKTEVDMKHTGKIKDVSRSGHDGFSKLESAPSSKTKMPSEPDVDVKNSNEGHKSSDSLQDKGKVPGTRGDTFGGRDDRVGSRVQPSRSQRDDRFGRRDGGFNRGNGNRNGNWSHRNDNRDRFRGRGPPRGQEGFSSARFVNGNQRQQVTVAQADRWKHDKFDEANQSPNKEDEDIARVERLLSS